MFSDGPTDLSGGSRHTDERGPQRQQSAGNEAPSFYVKADSRAIEQGNLVTDPSYHGGLEYVAQENVCHRRNTPKVVEEEGILAPAYASKLQSKVKILTDTSAN